MFRTLECDNCKAKGEATYRIIVATTGERVVFCPTCYAAGMRLAGLRAIITSEWQFSPALGGYVYTGYGADGPLIFRPGDAFPLWVRGEDGYAPMRAIVGAPGECGCIVTATQVVAGAAGLDDEPVILLSPEEARALQDMSRGGGSAQDDEP